MTIRALIILISTLSVVPSLKAQQTVNHHCDFESGLQSMWGANGVNFSINQTIPLFPEVNWNESFGFDGIVDAPLGLGSFGAAMNGNFSGTLGCEFALQGFTLGQIEVDYPVDITLDMPTDLTYDQGDDVVIETDYELAPGYALDTYYPSGGEATLDFYFGLGAGLSAEVCLFGCASFPIIPQFNTGIQNINIFTINVNEVSFLSLNGGTPLYSYPIFPLNTSMIPGDPLGQFGLNGTLDIPNVVTTDYANGTDLIACGESNYVNLNLDIFALLSNLPIPGAAALGYLSGTQNLGFGAYVYWNLLSASIDVNVINKQCFDFTPKVYGEFEFPVPVEYQIIDEVTGIASSRDTSSIITVELGDDLLYKFPCYFEELDITPTYSIDGVMRNHTWDSIPVDFLFSAFAFGLVVPEIEITSAIITPEICIGYPCGWFDWCTSCWDPPDIPAVTIDPPDFNIGPLIDLSVPITAIEYDWFDETWSLAGFSPCPKPPFTMIASPLGVSNIKTDVDCHGDATGAIDVSFNAITPATPYTYEWSNGSTIEDLTGLIAGQYQLSAFDANGCQHFTGATILEPDQPVTVNVNKTDKSCNGGIDDGEIDLIIQGGTAPHTVNWSNGMTGTSISGLATGSYTATITDARNCVETVVVVIDEPDVLGQTAAIADVLCFNGNSGAISVDTYGGSLPYVYSWDSGQTTEDIINVSAGNYTLTITDGRGCQSTNTYTVQEPATPVSLSTTAVDVLCHGAATGSIDLTVNGGTPGFTFQWNDEDGVVIPFQVEDIANMQAGEYTAVVTDANGCIDQITQLITEPTDPLLSSEIITDVLCNGEPTGAIDPAITGGTPGYNYIWSDGSTANVLANVLAGSYSLDITDANGCAYQRTYVITEPELLVVDADSLDVLCFGESTGELNVSASGGVGSYSYLWSNGATVQTQNNLPAGNYNVTVTDDHGCNVVAATTINQPLAPLSSSEIVTAVDCFGSNTGAINLTPVGGTSPYSYEWSNSGSIIFTDTTEDISALYSGVYLLTITDGHGCQLTDAITVTQPAAELQLTESHTNVLCLGSNEGSIDVTVSAGTATYTYNWSNGAITEDITGLAAGSYQLAVNDANGCSANITIEITEPSEELIATLESVDVKCQGGDDGYLLSEVAGGVPPYSYNWSNGSTAENIYNLTAGTYTLTVTDANGCQSFTGSTLTEPSSSMVVSDSVVDVLCFGGSDGEVHISVVGGVEPYYFDWGNQDSILMAEEGHVLDGLNIGNYLIRVVDANGCSIEHIVIVSEPPLLETSVEQTAEILCNGDSTAALDVTNWGGTPPYTTVWSTGDVQEDISALPTGWYYYITTDDHACEVNDSIFIDQPLGIWNSAYVKGVTCKDQSDGEIGIEVGGGVGDFTFEWSNGDNTPVVTDLESGDYWVVFADENGCSDTLYFNVAPSINSCLDIPNTFTPNGDDYNDTWFIENLHLYPNAEVVVFNKWGNQLYRSTGVYEPWDGTVNGNPLPAEVYYYVIVLNNADAEKYTGVVTIVR